jgi:hypothetical protein
MKNLASGVCVFRFLAASLLQDIHYSCRFLWLNASIQYGVLIREEVTQPVILKALTRTTGSNLSLCED